MEHVYWLSESLVKFFNVELEFLDGICHSYGATPEEAFGPLLSIWRDKWMPQAGEAAEPLDDYIEDIMVYAPETGVGYVVGVGDEYGRPVHGNGDDEALSALVGLYKSGTPISISSVADGESIHVVEVRTRRTSSQGFGRTPEEAMQALLTRWRVDYAPDADADEGYLAEIRGEISIFEVKLGQAYIDDVENSDFSRPMTMKGDDPRFDTIFEDYTQVAKPWLG
jgi:predicted RNase H-like HicB family nuclease